MHASLTQVGGILALSASLALGCSRVAYKARYDDRITIGRSMDMVVDTRTKFVTFPAGQARNGQTENPFRWTSKYGSVNIVMYDAVYTEGINTEGLTGSTLYLGDSEYGKRPASMPGMFVGIWMQYFLDTYASVDDIVKDNCPGFAKPKFHPVTKTVVEGVDTVVHVAFSDLSGDNVVMEYVDGGKLKCYHSHEYNVMTNEPTYDQQLAINAYWGDVSNYSLPGTDRPADRFARLSHYNDQIPPAKDLETAVSYTAGLIRAVSNPMITVDPKLLGKSDVWPTLWRTYIDTRDRVFFYESTTSPIFLWFDLDQLDQRKGAKAKVLSLVDVAWQDRVGDMTKKFKKL